MSKPQDHLQYFPAPSPRGYQGKAIRAVTEAFEDYDVVALNGPTGSGKSIMGYTIGRNVGSALYTTTLNSLVDQIDTDEFVGDEVLTVKGRANYECVHPEDRGTPVHEAICQRDDDFECGLKQFSCPYYSRRYNAVQHPFVVTNMAMAMADSLLPEEVDSKLRVKDVLIVDECHTIKDAAENFTGMRFSKYAMPKVVWDEVDLPSEVETAEDVRKWLIDEVIPAIEHGVEELTARRVLEADGLKKVEQIENFQRKIRLFLRDMEEHEWVPDRDTEIRKNAENFEYLDLNPLTIGRFLDNLLWSKGRKVLLMSATIPGNDWFSEMGLKGSVKRISMPSTFPVENRPIYTKHAVGKMVAERNSPEDNRKTNAWPMAKKIAQLAETYKDEGDPNGLVHCRSYGIANLIRQAYHNHEGFEFNGRTIGDYPWFKDNVQMQDRDNREESLEEWINSDTPVFFSVNMDTGVDLPGDKCRWQALAKTLYPFIDKRMERRKEIETKSDFWSLYNREAIIQIQQAAGRGVRSDEDYCAFYILDSSAIKLIQMNAEEFNRWWLEGIEDMRIDPSRGR